MGRKTNIIGVKWCPQPPMCPHTHTHTRSHTHTHTHTHTLTHTHTDTHTLTHTHTYTQVHMHRDINSLPGKHYGNKCGINGILRCEQFLYFNSQPKSDSSLQIVPPVRIDICFLYIATRRTSLFIITNMA